MRARRLIRRTTLGAALAASAALALAAIAWAPVVSGQIEAGDPSHSGALDTTFTSSCAGEGTVPPIATGTYRYDTHSGTTGTTSQCIQVTLQNTGTGFFDDLFSAAYLGSFVPTNLQTNWLGSIGQALPPGATRSYSFDVPANSTYVVVVEEFQETAGTKPYTVTYGPSTPTAVAFGNSTASRTARGVVVRWRTAAETRVLGFNVHRQQAARKVRANRTLLAATGRGARGGTYSFVDRRAPSGRVVYWIEAVDRSGLSTWHGPVVAR